MQGIVCEKAREWKSEIGDQFLDEGGEVADHGIGGSKTRQISARGPEEVFGEAREVGRDGATPLVFVDEATCFGQKADIALLG